MSTLDNLFVHAQGEDFGPVLAGTITTLLNQGRLTWADFFWQPGLAKWVRLVEVPEFVHLQPPYPKTPPPGSADPQAQPVFLPQSATTPIRIRRHSRIPLIATVNIEDYGSFSTVDVSQQGLFFNATIEIPIGSDVKFRLKAESWDRELSIVGTVVRQGTVDGHTGYGVEFKGMSPSDFEILMTHIKTRLNASAGA